MGGVHLYTYPVGGGDFRERAAQGPQTGHRWARFLGSPFCEVKASKGRKMQRDQVAIARKYWHLPGAHFGHKKNAGPISGTNLLVQNTRRQLWIQQHAAPTLSANPLGAKNEAPTLGTKIRGAHFGYKSFGCKARGTHFGYKSTRCPL